MTKKEKREYLFSKPVKSTHYLLGDLISGCQKYIYDCFNLAPYAEKAREAKQIVKYYDVVDLLFDTQDLMAMFPALLDASGLWGNKQLNTETIDEDIEQVKKL